MHIHHAWVNFPSHCATLHSQGWQWLHLLWSEWDVINKTSGWKEFTNVSQMIWTLLQMPLTLQWTSCSKNVGDALPFTFSFPHHLMMMAQGSDDHLPLPLVRLMLGGPIPLELRSSCPEHLLSLEHVSPAWVLFPGSFQTLEAGCSLCTAWWLLHHYEPLVSDNVS